MIISHSKLQYLPRFFTKKGILSFVAILVACHIIFINNAISLQWIIFGFVEVFGFFFFANLLTKRWADLSVKSYEKRLLVFSFSIRIIWVLFSYFYFSLMTGQPFEYETADALGYHNESVWLSGLLREGYFQVYLAYIGTNYADMGYPLYLGFLYYLFGDFILLPRLIKAGLGAVTCLLVYKVGRNNFGESTGRIAGILTMLLPNLIYYCGLHVKETEMVFLVVLFIYYADTILLTRHIKPKHIILMVSVGASVFLFRTVLAVCMFGSVLTAVFFISKRVSTIGKRLVLLVLLVIFGFILFSTSQKEVIFNYIQASDKNQTKQMENFSKRENANQLAKYGSRSVFLPFMLMAPFPTLVDTNQPNPMMLGGAFFTRNVYAYFVLVALFLLYKRKKLRDHVLLISILFSYLFVLASSGFALSERFHLPIVPFLLIFAAHGISQMTSKNKKYYIPYLLLVGAIVIGWNWFKLAGRA